MVREWLAPIVAVVELGMLGYFLVLNLLYIVFAVVAYVQLRAHRIRWTPRALDAVRRSPATPAISVIVPAYNEESTVVESVRGLLLLDYPSFELVVVDDGSTDRTMERLREAFALLPAPLAYHEALPTQKVSARYRSLEHLNLVVIVKENGGKADAMNAGINAAANPLVCVVDADSILEAHALTRAVVPFVESPDTVATGGIIRIANGCRVDTGRVTEVDMPRSWLARFQVLEYLRAFLGGRVAMSAMNALLIVSGAFGVFRRDLALAAGGFRHDTIGEDMELVVRLHRVCREQGRRYRIVFQPDPVCWTEAPEDRRSLGSQRNRWQRGTYQVLQYHRAMIGNPRYGVVGLFALPYFLIFEAFGPVFEALGYVLALGGWMLGVLDVVFMQLLFLVAVAFGAVISLTAVLLEELSYRRYPRVRHLLLLAALGVLENFGYRQMTTWWRLRGLIDFLRRKQGWGAMTRKGFSPGGG